MVDYTPGTTTDTDFDHNRTVTAFFDVEDAAHQARTDLIAAGVSPDAISFANGATTGAAPVGAPPVEDDNGGFWHALKEFFMPDEDRYVYAEGLRRGGFALSVRTDDATYDRVLDILDSDGAVDIDEREKSWRAEGWETPNPVRDAVAYARADAGTAGFGASLAGEDGYAPPPPLTSATTAEERADTSRVGTGANGPGLNPDVRERIGSGTASMTPPTPTGPQDATVNDNAATFDRRSAAAYSAATAAEDAALGSPTRSGAEAPGAARSTIGSVSSADADQARAINDSDAQYRRDTDLQRARVRGYIRDAEDRNGTI